MLPRTTGALILFAALSAAPATLLCHAQISAPVFPARYHLGDGPSLTWADPRFDDSAWPIAQRGQWPTPPFYSDGVVWVRMRIPVRTDAVGPLALRSSRDSILGGLPFGLADQVYVNRVLVGAEGSLPPRVRLDPQRDAVFHLPPSAATPGTEAVVALRIWIPPGLRRSANFGNLQISIDSTRNLQLAYLNHVLYGQIGGFVTCCAALIASDGAITIANAGNPAPYCNGEEMPVESGLPLGMIADAAYAETRSHIAAGDRITFVSDGVVEATNAHGELYGFDRTQAISTESPEKVAQAAQAFGQQDDITVLSLTRAAVFEPA